MEERYIKVMTYNIHSGRNLYMIPQMKKMINFLKKEKPHIIGIQEINENNKRGYQVSNIKDHLKMEGIFGENVKIGDGYYGLANFSCFKIIESKNIFLPSKKEQRSLLHTILEINDQKISILNTHLGLGVDERMKQFENIQKYIKSIAHPYILMGDFNTTKPILSNIDIIDAAKIMEKSYIPTLMSLKRRIDFLFVSKTIKIIDYKVFPVNMSDHYPVMIKITL